MDIKKIENATKRQVTFSKRRSSLMKKIDETAICCDIDAAFVAFSPSGRLSKFCSRNRIEDVLQRYLNLPPEEKHQSNSNKDHVEEKVRQLRHLSNIKGDENKLHCLNNKIKHMELQVKKSKIELEISEAELRNYLPDPTQDPSLAELEWCENHLKTSLQQMINIKRMLLNNFSTSFSETPRFQIEMKHHQQSFPRINDYEKKLYSGTNHQTSDHNLGQHDAWINPSRQPQPEGGAPQYLQRQVNASSSFADESIVNKPMDLSFLSFPSVQESSVGALIPQGHEHGPHSDASPFNVQLQGVTRDVLVPFGITGQTYYSVSNNSMEQTSGIPTSHLPANMHNLFWQDDPHSSATDNLDCNAFLDTESYPSFVNGNNDDHHAALYHGNPSSEKLEDLHLLNNPTSENNSIKQTFGIPTSYAPANVNGLFWQNGCNFSANDNLDGNALVDPERNIYLSFADGNNDGHHAALYHGNLSPEKQENLYLLNKPTSENNSFEQTFGIPTFHVPTNVHDLFWQSSHNFSANDNLDCNALVDPERNIYPSPVDGNNEGHHPALYHGNPSPVKQEDLFLLNKSTSEQEQGNMAPENLLSIEENPESRSCEWDGYALAKLLNSDKFDTMF